MNGTKDKVISMEPQPIGELEQYQQYQDLCKDIENNCRKDTRRMYVFFVLIFLAFTAVILISLVFIDGSFIAELRAGNSSLTKNTDYLELVLPILIAIAAAFIAFLGMNRLKDMDAQVSQMRDSINTELDKEIRRVASLRSDLAEHIDAAVSIKTRGFAQEMEEKLESTSKAGEDKVSRRKEAALLEIDKSKAESGQIMAQMRADLDAFDERYKWLLSNDQVTKNTFLKEVATVFDVHQAVEAMWSSKDKPDNIAEITKRYVIKATEENLRGDENDYHNLAAECARHYFYDFSCKICAAGLKYFPKNIDLLADWIQYGTKIGNIDAVEDVPLKNLLSMDKTQWNWRAFDFTVDFYLAAGKFEEAEKIANDFVAYCPYEERAYYCQAEVYQRRYAKEDGTQKTIAVLQRAIDKKINCPMCANKLAEILSDCGRLEEALAAATRAVQELSQEQPSVNYGYVIYRRALIQDRMAYTAYAVSPENDRAHDLAAKAAVDYQVAISSGRLSLITARQARVRHNLLKTYFNISDDEAGGGSSESASIEDLLAAWKRAT